MVPENKKIVIVIPAFNAQKTIGVVLSRIPAEFITRTEKIYVINDGSLDGTLAEAESLKNKFSNIVIINKEINEGYARAQKTGFRRALNEGADVIILLHADGQYAPEELPRLTEPLIDGSADVVQGSRMLGGALKGGMPLYKFLANKFLSKLENICYRMDLAEYHSGYMLYSGKALKTIPFEKLSDTFHFDGEMLFVANDLGLRIKEIAIPTHYGGEKSNLKPIKYGFDVLKIMLRYKSGGYNFKK
ncbi:glycosyltransferase family 2 protein [Candidatus Parcubacteria bacterium]|nr:MAG: glycosyltransferase family 2 protein [Candidatus Parcubacteria bacterium]